MEKSNNQSIQHLVGAMVLAVSLTLLSSTAFAVDHDGNPPGAAGGPGTNWENPAGPAGGPGVSPNRYGWRHHAFQRWHWRRDHDGNPPGAAGGPGTNWENRPGPAGGPGASPDRKKHFWRR